MNGDLEILRKKARGGTAKNLLKWGHEKKGTMHLVFYTTIFALQS